MQILHPPFERPVAFLHTSNPIYAIDANGRLLPAGRKYDDRDAENMDAHIFNRLSKRWRGILLFPVWLPVSISGWTINQLDSGCQTIFQLSKTETRNTNWSCAMGIVRIQHVYAPSSNVYSVMERSLIKGLGIWLKLEIHSFELWPARQCRDEFDTDICSFQLPTQAGFIVAHDGWNDIVYGMVQDPRLLKEAILPIRIILRAGRKSFMKLRSCNRLKQERLSVR